MKKQLLILATVSILGFAGSGAGLAAPAGSTEDADRQFLKQLEASGGAPNAPNAQRNEETSPEASPSKTDAAPKKTTRTVKVSDPVRRLRVEGRRLLHRLFAHLP